MTTSDGFESRFHRAKQASLGQVLVKAARLVNEHAVGALRADPRYAQMRLRHLAIFPHLDFEEGSRITDLAARMQMTKQGVGQLVTELESFGVLERIRDPSDGRAKLVRLTAVGRAAMFDGLAALGGTEDVLQKALGSELVLDLHTALLKVVEALEGD